LPRILRRHCAKSAATSPAFVPPGDDAAFARAIKQALATIPRVRPLRGRRGRARAQHFSWRRTAEAPLGAGPA